MNWDRKEGHGKSFKVQAKQKWGKFTDDNLDMIEGRHAALEGKIQPRIGNHHNQIKTEIDE